MGLLAYLVKNQHELIAANSSHLSIVADAALYNMGNVNYHIIAAGMTKSVVNTLEVVDIQHQQCQWCCEAAQAAPFSQQLLVEVATVVQAGQAVEL